jgi:hypothetical protein
MLPKYLVVLLEEMGRDLPLSIVSAFISSREILASGGGAY